MNIMHNKVVKFLMQLRHTMHGEWCNTAKYPNISCKFLQLHFCQILFKLVSFHIVITSHR